MKLYLRIEAMLLGLLQWFWKRFITLHEYINVIRKWKLISSVSLTKEQKDQIDKFYIDNYGKKIPYWWHRLYQSYTGNFDPLYFPEIFFSTRLELQSNKRIDALRYENKNMLNVIASGVPEVRTPDTFIMCVNGCYYDHNRNIISRNTAVSIVSGIAGGAVAKITIDTSSGRGVHVLNIANSIDTISGKPVVDIIDSLGDNFVVQERLQAHSSLATIYADSINTIRVITYIADDQINVAPLTLRIGRGGNLVDNAHAGGIFVGVSDEGKLRKEAYTEYQQRFERHPDSGVVFENYQIPYVEQIREAAIKMHQQIPMFRFVSWDFTIDKNSQIVLVEMNLHSQTVWFPQMANGCAFFGNNTGIILQELNRKRRHI